MRREECTGSGLLAEAGEGDVVAVVVVMPGVVNTDIYVNSRRALGQPEWEQPSDAQLLELIPDDTRAALIAMGWLPEDFSADDLPLIAQAEASGSPEP